MTALLFCLCTLPLARLLGALSSAVWHRARIKHIELAIVSTCRPVRQFQATEFTEG